MTTKPPNKPLPTTASVPPQVCAALEYLTYSRGVSSAGVIHSAAGDQIVPGRKLDVLELRTCDAALEVVRAYLSIAGKHLAGYEERLEQAEN